MSTSDEPAPVLESGFTLVELMVGLSIAVCLAAALVSVWLSYQNKGDGEADSTVWYLQARVAAARFERDLRLASAAGSAFQVAGPVLEASPLQVVFLDRAADGSPLLIEWEIAKGALMRRWGPCPSMNLASFAHSMYSDSKTMLDNLRTASAFSYIVNGQRTAGPVEAADLVFVDGVTLDLAGNLNSAWPTVRTGSMARVGR